LFLRSRFVEHACLAAVGGCTACRFNRICRSADENGRLRKGKAPAGTISKSTVGRYPPKRSLLGWDKARKSNYFQRLESVILVNLSSLFGVLNRVHESASFRVLSTRVALQDVAKGGILSV
jgi:hypothetical protein